MCPRLLPVTHHHQILVIFSTETVPTLTRVTVNKTAFLIRISVKLKITPEAQKTHIIFQKGLSGYRESVAANHTVFCRDSSKNFPGTWLNGHDACFEEKNSMSI